MAKILKMKFRAGTGWDGLLNLFCIKYKIPYEQNHGYEDLIVVLELNTNEILSIGIELKASDLHGSLFGKREDSKLTTELLQEYVGKFDRVYVMVAGEPLVQELKVLASLSCKYDFFWKWAKDRETVIEDLYDLLTNLDKTYRTYYVNDSDAVTLIEAMMRKFMGEDRILPLLENLETKGNFVPKDQFSGISDCLSGEFKRKWDDWFFNGIEPSTNDLWKRVWDLHEKGFTNPQIAQELCIAKTKVSSSLSYGKRKEKGFIKGTI